jgi:MFS family permease
VTAAGPSLITPTIAACLAISGGVHVVIYLLNATLPLHVVGLGGSKTQVGLLFATSTSVSMILRPLVGGWVDRFGARRVMLPGVAVLLATLVLLPVAAAPAAYVALMAGLGCGNGVLATAAGVLVAQASPAARRGEALSVYFLATALSFAAGPPLGLALYARAGIQACFAASVALSALIAGLILSLKAPALGAVSSQGFRWFSRRALPAAATVVCVNIGYSSIYAFLPLYALASGLEGSLGWFYVLFAICIITGRLTLRGLSDRIGPGPGDRAGGDAHHAELPDPRPAAARADPGRGRDHARSRRGRVLSDPARAPGGPHAGGRARLGHGHALRLLRLRQRARLAPGRLHGGARVLRGGVPHRGGGRAGGPHAVRGDGAARGCFTPLDAGGMM